MAEEQKTALNFNEIKHLLLPNYSDMEISELEKLAGHGQDDSKAMHELVKRHSPKPTFVIDSPVPNYEEAFRWVLKLVEKGDWQGRHWLADCYFTGKRIVNAEPEKAIELLKKNATEGDYFAYVRLAYYYAHGKGVEKDFSEAVEWLTKIVSCEDKDPNFNPHQLFTIEHGVNLTYEICPEFTYLYEEPRYKLAELYLQGGFGIEQDFSKAVEWLNKSIERRTHISADEVYRARFKRGECYFNGGPNLEQDYGRAIKYFEEIANCHRPYSGVESELIYTRLALRKLGLCYALGKGVDQDFLKAKDYFEKAARKDGVHYGPNSIMVDPEAEAELGICYYRLGEINMAKECFEQSCPSHGDQMSWREERDSLLGKLWLTYLLNLENEELRRSNVNYVPYLHRQTSRLPTFDKKPSNEDEKLSKKIDVQNHEINRRLMVIAVECEQLVREGGCLDLDLLAASTDVLKFLQDRKKNVARHPSQIILAFFYKSIQNESQFLSCLEQAHHSCNDVIANYWLGRWYEHQNPKKAVTFLEEVLAKKNNDRSGYPSHGVYVNLLELMLKDIKLEIANKELKSKNTELELARQKLTELVRSTSHTAGNLLRPNTQAKIAKRLKDIKLKEDANKLYYAASDIKYVKLQFKLLEIMQTLTGSQSIINQIQLDRVEKDNERAMNIDGILNLAAFRAIDKVFDQHEYSLDFARETLRKTVPNYEELSNSYQDLVLKMDEKPSVIRWCSEHLRPVRINYECDTWKELYFHENSQTVALFFCYFFELFFNAFKYADHNADDFLTITLGMETINNQDFLTMHWQNPVGTQKSFGSGKGLHLSESYIGLLNDDVHRNLSQQIVGFSDNVFELIVRISKKNMLGE